MFSTKSDKNTKKLYLDILRLHEVPKIDLSGLDHVVILSVLNGVILFRQYMVKLLKSGTKIPRVELIEVGPNFDCTLRRSKFASSDLMKESLRVPAQLQNKKKKNISSNETGDTLGTIHTGRQNFDNLTNARFKAFKKRKTNPNAGEGDNPAKRQKIDE